MTSLYVWQLMKVTDSYVHLVSLFVGVGYTYNRFS